MVIRCCACGSARCAGDVLLHTSLSCYYTSNLVLLHTEGSNIREIFQKLRPDSIRLNCINEIL